MPEALLSRDEFNNILVVRQHDQLGDMLCATPLLRALHRSFPSASITLVASPVNAEIMRYHPNADKLLIYDKQRMWSSPRLAVEFLSALRRGQFDLAIVPTTVSMSVTSAVIAFLSGARVRIGPRSLGDQVHSARRLFTHPVDLDWSADPHRYQTLRNLDILSPLGLRDEDPGLTIGLTRAERESAAVKIAPLRSRSKFLLGIHPGAGKAGNRWPADRFAELVNKFHRDTGAGIVVTSGPMDVDILQALLPLLTCSPLILDRVPIRQVAAVINELDLFVSNDTGLMHVAGATGSSVLSLFGPTDPLQWAPVRKGSRWIAGKDGDISSIELSEVIEIAELMILESRTGSRQDD